MCYVLNITITNALLTNDVHNSTTTISIVSFCRQFYRFIDISIDFSKFF